jgi:hypothetical protein
MASPKEFNLSKHAFERLLERDKDFFLSLDKGLTYNQKWTKAVQYFQESVEDRSFLNNTSFMVHLQEKYGYDPTYIFVKNNSIFVGYRKPDNRHIIVTALQRDMKTAKHLQHKRTKYTKRD